jgi:hypothetical protein
MWLCTEQNKNGQCWTFASDLNKAVNWNGTGIRSIGQWPRARCYWYTEYDCKGGTAMKTDTLDSENGVSYPVLPPAFDGKIKSWACFDYKLPTKREIAAVAIKDHPIDAIADVSIPSSAVAGAGQTEGNGSAMTFFSEKHYKGLAVIFPNIVDDGKCWSLGDFKHGSVQQTAGHLCKYYYSPACTVGLFAMDTLNSKVGAGAGTGDLGGFTDHVKSVACQSKKWTSRSVDIALAPSEASVLPTLGDVNGDVNGTFFYLYPQKNYQGIPLVVKGVHDDDLCLYIGNPMVASLSQLAGHSCRFFTGSRCDVSGVAIDSRDLQMPAGKGTSDLGVFTNNIHSLSCAKLNQRRSTDVALAPLTAQDLGEVGTTDVAVVPLKVQDLGAAGTSQDDTEYFFHLYPQQDYQGLPLVVSQVHDDGACLSIGNPMVASLTQNAGHKCTYYMGTQCDILSTVFDTTDISKPDVKGAGDILAFTNNIRSLSCAKLT